MRRRLQIPSIHLHVALCIGDDENINLRALFRGWHGKILTKMGFTVAARWALLHREPVGGPHELHIIPLRDGMDHDLHRGDCVCGPFGVLSGHGDLPATWLITHQSLDVREMAPTEKDFMTD